MMTVFDLITQAKELSVAEQIDLIYYLSQHLNKDQKLVHVAFLNPNELDRTPLTDEEFETFLEWLHKKHRNEDPSSLNIPKGKRIQLIEQMSPATEPPLSCWGVGKDRSTDEEFMEYEQSLRS